MAWAVTNLSGRVISVGYGNATEPLPVGYQLHDITHERVESIMRGSISLDLALVPDADLLHTILQDMNPIPVEWRNRCTLLGDNVNHGVWGAVLAGLDVALIKHRHLVVWDWRYNQRDAIHTIFPWTQWQNITERHAPKDIIFLIDSHWEAPNPNLHFGALGVKLKEFGIPHAQIINWNNTSVSFNEGITININYTMACGQMNDCELDQIDPSHHFVFLARHPRALRVMAAVRLLERGLDMHGYISCGVNYEPSDTWISELVPTHLRHRFPLQIDALIGQTDLRQYSTIDQRIRRAAINLIGETSQDLQLAKTKESDWFDPFVTEKTSKAFRLGQLPIWIGVPGQVAAARDLGLDVYDDIINHSYDIIEDPQARIESVLDELQRWCAMPLDELSTLRCIIWPRITANKDLIDTGIRTKYQRMSNMLETHFLKI